MLAECGVDAATESRSCFPMFRHLSSGTTRALRIGRDRRFGQHATEPAKKSRSSDLDCDAQVVVALTPKTCLADVGATLPDCVAACAGSSPRMAATVAGKSPGCERADRPASLRRDWNPTSPR